MQENDINNNVCFESIFEQLNRWRLLPKYQLERRLDIFIAMCLPKILKKAKLNVSLSDIIPEFPLRKDKNTNRTTNADYAFCKINENKVDLYMVELKTDINSINKDQLKSYLDCIKHGFLKSLKDIKKIQESPNSDWKKYDNLFAKLEEYGVVKCTKKQKEHRRAKWEIVDKKLGNIKVVFIIPNESKNEPIMKIVGKDTIIITFDNIKNILENNYPGIKKLVKSIINEEKYEN